MWELHRIRRAAAVEGFYTAFADTYTPDYVFRGEIHDFWELVVVRSGCLNVTAGADSLLLPAGSAILHPPMEFHSLRSERETSPEIMVFSFAASEMPSYETRVFSLDETAVERAARVLALLRESTTMNGKSSGETIVGKEREAQIALTEFELLLLSLVEQRESEKRNEGTAGIRNYRRALAVMEKNLSRPLDTAELARLCRMSPSLLKKTFSHYAGIGVMEYFRTRKINAAIPMLREGRGVQEIAAALGFGDAGYFSTVFRRVTGHTPTYYRTH